MAVDSLAAPAADHMQAAGHIDLAAAGCSGADSMARCHLRAAGSSQPVRGAAHRVLAGGHTCPAWAGHSRAAGMAAAGTLEAAPAAVGTAQAAAARRVPLRWLLGPLHSRRARRHQVADSHCWRVGVLEDYQFFSWEETPVGWLHILQTMLQPYLLVPCTTVVQPALQWQRTQMSRRRPVRVRRASVWLLLLWRHGAIPRGLRCAIGAWLLVCRPPCIRGTKILSKCYQHTYIHLQVNSDCGSHVPVTQGAGTLST